MPTRREREYYRMGYEDGFSAADMGRRDATQRWLDPERRSPLEIPSPPTYGRYGPKRRKPRSRRKPVKLSKWQRYIKNKKNHIKLRNGKLNLKKMAVQYRKKNK